MMASVLAKDPPTMHMKLHAKPDTAKQHSVMAQLTDQHMLHTWAVYVQHGIPLAACMRAAGPEIDRR